MSSEGGMDALGAAAKAVDPLHDPRWDKLAMGALSGDERAAFEAELKATEAGRRAWEMLAPPSAEAHEQNVDALLARATKGQNAAPSAAPKRQFPAIAALMAAALMAAALVIAIVLWPKGASELPSYRMEVSSELAPVWGSDTVHLKPGSLVSIVIRPDRAHPKPISVHATLAPDAGGVVSWSAAEARAVIAPGGAVKIVGSREELFRGLPSGGYDVAIAVRSSVGLGERQLKGRVFLDP